MKRKLLQTIGITLLSACCLCLSGNYSLKAAENTAADSSETAGTDRSENQGGFSLDGYGDDKWGTSLDEILSNTPELSQDNSFSALVIKEAKLPETAEALEPLEDEEEENTGMPNEETMYFSYNSSQEALDRRRKDAQAANRETVMLKFFRAEDIRFGLYKANVQYVFEEDKLAAVSYSQGSNSFYGFNWPQSDLKKQYTAKYGAPSFSISEIDEYSTSGIDLWRDENKNILFVLWSENNFPSITYLSGDSYYMEYICREYFENDDSEISRKYCIKEYIDDGIINYGI